LRHTTDVQRMLEKNVRCSITKYISPQDPCHRKKQSNGHGEMNRKK
jgi:hypothetical protein